MKYFAYCPILVHHDEAAKYVKSHLKTNFVIIVLKDFKGNLYHREMPVSKRNKADDYGFDLYLYQVDASHTEKYLDCGGFN